MQPDPLLDHRSETLLAVTVYYAASRFTATERLGKGAGIQAA